MKKKSIKYRFLAKMASMMIACDKASYLISRNIENKLSFKEKIQLKAHLLSCHLCRKYEKDINALNSYLKNEEYLSCPCHHLDAKQKENIQSHILKDNQ